MKYSVFSVMLPEYNVPETIDLLQKCGYDGVEWRFAEINPSFNDEAPSYWRNNRSTIHVDSTAQELQEIRRSMNEAGLEIPNLACYMKFADIGSLERDLQAAQLLGAPSLRIRSPYYDRKTNYHELFTEARQYLTDFQRLSQSYGIKGVIELHPGNITPSASAAYRLVEGFDPDCIGVIYDPGNMVDEGYENYRMGLEMLGPYLAHVHVKNTGWVYKKQDEGSPWKSSYWEMSDGIVDWKQVISDLKSVGYDGWLSFEDFSRSNTMEEMLKNNLSYMKTLEMEA